jgi:hypothetical protein
LVAIEELGPFPQCKKRTFRIDPSRIGFLKFILEAYEGLGQLTTLNPALGLVIVYVPPGRSEEFENLVTDLKKEIFMETAVLRQGPPESNFLTEK